MPTFEAKTKSAPNRFENSDLKEEPDLTIICWFTIFGLVMQEI